MYIYIHTHTFNETRTEAGYKDKNETMLGNIQTPQLKDSDH